MNSCGFEKLIVFRVIKLFWVIIMKFWWKIGAKNVLHYMKSRKKVVPFFFTEKRNYNECNDANSGF